MDPAALEADCIAREWLDRQRLSRAEGTAVVLLRAPVSDEKLTQAITAEDYEVLITKARGDYGHNRTGSISRRFWALIGLLVLAANGFAEWEERCWRGECREEVSGHAG